LVRTAVILFAAGLPVNLAALIWGKKSWLTWGKAFAWGKALTWAAIIIWLAHTLFSMMTTYAAWGLLVAWYEPRTRFTFNLAGVGIIVLLVSHFMASTRFSAMVFVLLSGIVLALLPGLGFIQHPLDPIGTSTSSTIRLFYAAIQVVSVILGGVLVIWLRDRIEAVSEK
jgi:hypothetical protein